MSELFVTYHERVTAFIYSRLISRDWHLAEDLTSDVFIELMCSYTMRDREIDGRVWGLLATIARRMIARHFARSRATETSTDFGDWFEARRLPTAPAAGEIAVVRMEASRELAERPAPTTPAARRQFEALTELAVAA
ncbi:RNA polymerase sigma factor [Streptomyces sp. NPDC088910]|uniref:RNA polymerase sigma factor n=1 Tax=Streptomyces sp. NPDC088910 TaxID=3365911 RepID=UPI0037F971B4